VRLVTDEELAGGAAVWQESRFRSRMEELAVSPLCLIGDDEDALAAVLSVTWPVREEGEEGGKEVTCTNCLMIFLGSE
jgi:hypothetical protein